MMNPPDNAVSISALDHLTEADNSTLPVLAVCLLARSGCEKYRLAPLLLVLRKDRQTAVAFGVMIDHRQRIAFGERLA